MTSLSEIKAMNNDAAYSHWRFLPKKTQRVWPRSEGLWSWAEYRV